MRPSEGADGPALPDAVADLGTERRPYLLKAQTESPTHFAETRGALGRQDSESQPQKKKPGQAESTCPGFVNDFGPLCPGRPSGGYQAEGTKPEPLALLAAPPQESATQCPEA